MFDFESVCNGGICRIEPYVAGKPIEEVQRELNISNIIKLASNENPYGMSKKAIKACIDKLSEVHLYPDSHGYYLKQKLYDKFFYNKESITFGDGSNELINLIFQAFANDKVNVIIPELSFVVYTIESTVCNSHTKIIKLNDDYTINLDSMYEAIDDKTRIIVIANPANPTGTAVATKELYNFIKKVPEHTLVVLDEAYNEFQDKDTYEDTAKWLLEFSNLVICRTFSKAYGLAGLRIGYMLAHPKITAIIDKLRAPFNVNLIAQVAAIEALDDDEHLNFVVKSNNKERLLYESYCKDRNLFMIKSQANFVTIDFKEDAMPIYQKLLENGIIVRPLKGYGLPTMLRVSIGTHDENAKFFTTLDMILGK